VSCHPVTRQSILAISQFAGRHVLQESREPDEVHPISSPPHRLWGIAAAAFIAILALRVPFPLIVLAAGLIGYLGGKVAPDKFAAGGGHGKAAKTFGPALIDDDTPTPQHALFTWARFRKVLVIFLGLWSAAMGGLVVACGRDAVLTQMGWFFTKAALLTFGGAYAVLPYVYQGAVDTFHWLTPTQMIDGLALGETTPGPLIMVVSFVGFVGGWTQAIFGTDSLLLSGAVAATVVTFFTFLPSFFFILIGAPFIESTHGNLKFTAPLTGITAAVVGVIANLAVFFAYHVLWPHGLAGHFEWLSAVIGLAAAVALFRFKVGVIPVVLGSGLAGLAYQLAHAALFFQHLRKSSWTGEFKSYRSIPSPCAAFRGSCCAATTRTTMAAQSNASTPSVRSWSNCLSRRHRATRSTASSERNSLPPTPWCCMSGTSAAWEATARRWRQR
jgi:chromate transport protein ChrA